MSEQLLKGEEKSLIQFKMESGKENRAHFIEIEGLETIPWYFSW